MPGCHGWVPFALLGHPMWEGAMAVPSSMLNLLDFIVLYGFMVCLVLDCVVLVPSLEGMFG